MTQTGADHLFKDAPEFPPRYQLRFGSNEDINKLKSYAETFKLESRNLSQTLKASKVTLPTFFSTEQSPIRAAGASMMGMSGVPLRHG